MKREKQMGLGHADTNVLSAREKYTGREVAFVGCCDGITFGVDQNGTPFHTSRGEFTPEHQQRWATANARFFQSIADRLDRYAEAVRLKEIKPDARKK